MIQPPSSTTYQAVIFDAFGTLVETREQRNPYRKLFESLGCNLKDARHLAMTRNADISDLMSELMTPISPDNPDYQVFQRDLEAEIKSVRLLPHIDNVLRKLRSDGCRIWVVSNLAKPYGKPLMDILEGRVDGFTLSYLCGSVKPEQVIYLKACDQLEAVPEDVIMIGDNQKNDVDGAITAGLNAVLVPDAGITPEWIDEVVKHRPGK